MEQIKNREKFMQTAGLTGEKLQYALEKALEKIERNLEEFVTVFPSHASVNNVYAKVENIGGWNQGFWTGILWIAYELTGNEKYRKAAERQIPTYTKRIKEKLGVEHHDMGFLFLVKT